MEIMSCFDPILLSYKYSKNHIVKEPIILDCLTIDFRALVQYQTWHIIHGSKDTNKPNIIWKKTIKKIFCHLVLQWNNTTNGGQCIEIIIIYYNLEMALVSGVSLFV